MLAALQSHSSLLPRFTGLQSSGFLAHRGSAKPELVPQSPLNSLISEIPEANRVLDKPVTADRAAGNILLFIERQLHADAEQGRTPEQLQSRLDAGLKGFLEGFNDAQEQLSQMGLLSDAMSAEIGQTYDKVLKGLGQLAQELGLDDSAIKAADHSESATSAPVELGSPVSFGGEMRGVIKAQKSFEFSVQTQEGDIVKISASSRFSAKSVMGPGGTSTGMAQSQQFNLTIEGDLNAEELASINDLLEQVNNISEQFFSGDLDTAFQTALDLEFNAEDIAGFAVDLKQSVVQKVRTTYGQDSQETSPLRSRMQPLGQMAVYVQAALDSAKQFLNSTAMLESLLTGNHEESATESPMLSGPKADLHRLFEDVNQKLLGKLAPANA